LSALIPAGSPSRGGMNSRRRWRATVHFLSRRAPARNWPATAANRVCNSDSVKGSRTFQERGSPLASGRARYQCGLELALIGPREHADYGRRQVLGTSCGRVPSSKHFEPGAACFELCGLDDEIWRTCSLGSVARYIKRASTGLDLRLGPACSVLSALSETPRHGLGSALAAGAIDGGERVPEYLASGVLLQSKVRALSSACPVLSALTGRLHLSLFDLAAADGDDGRMVLYILPV
jgi:hypothetical protein